MPNAILVHGSCDRDEYYNSTYPSLSNSHWFPWLQKQLLVRNIPTQTPEMPEPYRPDYFKWKGEFEKQDISSDTILIGHSCGAGFLARWLTENRVRVGRTVFVAPWMDPQKQETTSFFDFNLDPDLPLRMNSTHMFISDNDNTTGVTETALIFSHMYADRIREHRFSNKGHFTYGDMGTQEFPELLQVAVAG